VLARSRLLLAVLVTGTVVAGCGGPHVPPFVNSPSKTGPAAVSALPPGRSLTIAGTLTEASASRWCIRDAVTQICAPPAQQLLSTAMPAAFRPGIFVNAELVNGPASQPGQVVWTGVQMQMGSGGQ
jgi:hypothetical protein